MCHSFYYIITVKKLTVDKAKMYTIIYISIKSLTLIKLELYFIGR